jgi:hypothetical protein
MASSFPQLIPRKEIAVADGLRSQSSRLPPHIRLPEQKAPNTPESDAVILVKQVLLGGNLADDGGEASVRGYCAACVVGGVNCLDYLLGK